MLKNPSLITRIAIGKTIGLIIGVIGFFYLPYLIPDAELMLRWGVLLWYITLGAIIGVFGVFTWHPILKIPMPWWFMGPWLGAWMNFILVLLAYDEFNDMTISIVGEESIWSSPFWFALEGAIFGLLTGYLCKRYGGEGKETVDVK